jgi:hypothetical protein
MKPSFYKGIMLGAVVSMLVLVASTAVAGTGIGGIFNLGQSNTVDATSSLSGASTGAQLQVTNTGTSTAAQGIAAFNKSAAATLYGRNSGTGPAVSGRADQKNNGVEGVSAGAGASGVFGANTSATGFGVAGRSTGASGIGVYGNNTAGGLGVSGKSTSGNAVQGTSTSGNGVQGTSAGDASGVYGQNTGSSGYGVAGRSYGASGIGVFGDNAAGGWAGVFAGKVHLDGALDCIGCVSAGDISGKVNDSDKLDGIDSTGFVQGGGKAVGQALAEGPGVHLFLGPAMGGFLRLSYACPATLTNNGTFKFYNDSGSDANVFVESGGANPAYYALAPLEQVALGAAPGGDSWHIQAQGALGVLTIEAASVHRASDCHAQAQALLTN